MIIDIYARMKAYLKSIGSVPQACPCGYLTHPTKPCRCRPHEVRLYQQRISGPLLDRMDIQVEVGPVEVDDLAAPPQGATSSELRPMVARARAIQARRFAGTGRFVNADMTPSQIEAHCRLGEGGQRMLDRATTSLSLSARAYTRIKKISRTIADLEGSEEIQDRHLAEAIQYRGLDRRG